MKFFGLFGKSGMERSSKAKGAFSEFHYELTYIHVSSKVLNIIDTFREHFMIFLKEGLVIVYKNEIKNAHIFPQGRNNVNKHELNILKQYVDKNTKT